MPTSSHDEDDLELIDETSTAPSDGESEAVPPAAAATDDEASNTELDLPRQTGPHRIDVERAPAVSTLEELHDTLENAPPAVRPALGAAAAIHVMGAERDRPSRDAEPPASPLALGDAPPSARPTTGSAGHERPPPGDHPWWSWRGWRLHTKVLVVTGGILVALLITTWLMLPTIVGWVIRREVLPKAEQELGRKIEFGGVELHGLSGLTLTDVVIYDTDGSGRFIEVGAVSVMLTRSPVFRRDFRVESITVEAPSFALRRDANGESNYADFAEKLEKLFEDKPKDPTRKKKPSPIARYLRPMPRIEVSNGRITFDDALAASATITALEDVDVVVTQPEIGAPFDIDVTTEVAYRLEASETPRRQRLSVRGTYLNKNTGRLEVGFEGGLELPMVREIAGVDARVGSIAVELPATFVVSDLVIGSEQGGLEWPLLMAERTTVELTQLPPKKIGGVYLNETRIEGLRLSLEIDETGQTNLEPIVERVIEYFMGPRPTPAQQYALSIERELERGARAGAGMKQRKPKKFNPADYFFSQRVFIERSAIELTDASESGSSGSTTTLENLELMLGYRPIQKRVELELAVDVDGGRSGKLWLGGGYDLTPQTVDARLELDAVSLAPFAPRLEAAIASAYERAFGAATGADGEPADAKPGVQLRDAVLLTLARALRLGEVRVSSALEVEVDIKREQLGAQGELTVEDLQVVEARLSELPLDDLDVTFELEAAVDLAERRLELARLDANLDGMRLESRLTVEPRQPPPPEPSSSRRRSGRNAATEAALQAALAPQIGFDLVLRIPEQPAQQVFDGVPHGLRPALDGMELEGTFGFELSVSGTADRLKDLSLETKLLGEGFRVTRWPSQADVTGLNRGMRMTVRDPRATQPHTIVIPPSTHEASPKAAPWARYVADDGSDHATRYPHWVRYHELSPWLVQLITTTEDGSFFRHSGFSTLQITSALGENVAEGEFVRGASTISMQLVKNVFLGRQKTLARKLQEAFLTWLMESVVQVPKARILEVYFNVIEFGPEVYGIGEAARYYFGKQASDLTLREAAFLVSIIPQPRTGEPHRLRGTPTDRKSDRMNWFIDTMYARKCDAAALERMRRQNAKRGVAVEFCCPPASVIQRLKAEEVRFYVPRLEESPYRPDLYDSRGRLLGSRPDLGCDVGEDGLHGESGDAFEGSLPGGGVLPDPDVPLPPGP